VIVIKLAGFYLEFDGDGIEGRCVSMTAGHLKPTPIIHDAGGSKKV
jgi:hypothetical protein